MNIYLLHLYPFSPISQFSCCGLLRRIESLKFLLRRNIIVSHATDQVTAKVVKAGARLCFCGQSANLTGISG